MSTMHNRSMRLGSARAGPWFDWPGLGWTFAELDFTYVSMGLSIG